MNQIFKEVTDEKNRPLKIYSEIKEDSLRIVILQQSEAWSTDVKKQAINDLSKRLNVSPEKYYRDLTLYLQNDSGNLSYKLEGDEFILYYKPGSNIKIKYFFHNLDRVDYFSTVDALLDKFFKDRTLYLSQVANIQSQNMELAKNKAILEEKLQDLVNRKQEEEEKLYSSFVLVLNEKKRQIQHLNELLEAFRQGRPTLNPPISSKKKNKISIQHGRKTKLEVKNEVSESDHSSNEHDTDEENPSKVVTVSEEINIQPSTSKDHFGLWNNDEESCSPSKMDKNINFSLLESDEDEKLISLPKKKKKICHDDGKQNNNSVEQTQINQKFLDSTDDRHFPSIKLENSGAISDNMSSFIGNTSLEREHNFENHEVKGDTHAFTTLSNDSVTKSPSTMSTVKEVPVEASLTYDTEELLDRI